MIPNIVLTKMTPKQRQAWRMRYEFGWRIERIAAELGTSKSAVCEILQRARRRVGMPIRRHGQRRAPKWRVVRPTSLSNVFDC